MMLTNIPYFKEVIIMSFRCEYCGNENNEIQSAGTIRGGRYDFWVDLYLWVVELGTLYTTRILDRSDLNRQLVKASTCTLVIPEFELTIPASRGQLTTVEGIIRDTVRDLSLDQPLRRIQDPSTYEKLETLLDKLRAVLGDEDEESGSGSEKPLVPFTVQLDDPTGNSWIEFYGSMDDPKWSMRQYERTVEQNVAIGLVSPDEAAGVRAKHVSSAEEALGAEDGLPNEEIYSFPGSCTSCHAPLETRMKRVIIPYFKVSGCLCCTPD